MTGISFGAEFGEMLIARIHAGLKLEERCAATGGAFLTLVNVDDGSNAGYLRLWAVTDASHADRLIHFRLHSPPVDTHLLFLFGRPETAMPHFHAQVVQFGPDACVYNADLIPRLDPVAHPEHYKEVFGPVTKAYWKATTDRQNTCAAAPANPAIAAYLSPWSIAAGRPTSRAELERVTPSILAYLDQCLLMSRSIRYAGASPDVLRERDERHMQILHSDELDPRAWKGVYRVIGEEAGKKIRQILGTPVR
jgi:hypothetical protein